MVTFAGLPDIPIAEFTLTFDGATRGLVIAGVETSASHRRWSSTLRSWPTRAPRPRSGRRSTPRSAEAKGNRNRRPWAKVKLGKLSSDEPTLG